MAQHGGSVVDMQRTLLERLCGLSISIIDEADGEAGLWDDICLRPTTLSLRSAGGALCSWWLLFCVTSPDKCIECSSAQSRGVHGTKGTRSQRQHAPACSFALTALLSQR